MIAAIETEGLTKRFGQRTALAPTSWNVGRGQVWLLLGANGSGKSTLLALLAGLLVPSGGRARLCGRDVRDPESRRHLGVLVQRSALPGRNDLRTLMKIRHASDPSGLLGTFGLEAETGPVGRLSAGQRQRARIALALHGPIQTLLLDEPLTALDSEGMSALRDAVVSQMKGGCTVVIATHRPSFWRDIGSHRAEMVAGVLQVVECPA